MKYFIKSNIQIVDDKQASSPYFFDYNTTVALTAGALKTIIKNEYHLPPFFVNKEEVLTVDGKTVTDDIIVPFKSKITYTLKVTYPSTTETPVVPETLVVPETPVINVPPVPSVVPTV